jgi:hypothetical protein
VSAPNEQEIEMLRLEAENKLLWKRLGRIREEHLTWAIGCECICDACRTFSNIIRLSTEPQEAKHE